MFHTAEMSIKNRKPLSLSSFRDICSNELAKKKSKRNNITLTKEKIYIYSDIFYDLSTNKRKQRKNALFITIYYNYNTILKDFVFENAKLHIDFLMLANYIFDNTIYNIKMSMIDKLIKYIDSFLNKFYLTTNDFMLLRIDYCYNVVANSEKELNLYTLLAVKNLHKFDHLFYNNTFKTSLYCSNKSNAINIYNKPAERKAKNLAILDHEKNVLRIEYQVKKGRIAYNKQSKDISNNLTTYLSYNMFSSLFITKINRYLTTCDYYTFARARTIINKSSYKEKLKKDILKFLYKVAYSANIDKAVKSLKLSRYKRDKIYTALKKLNIARVCIPKNLPFASHIAFFLNNVKELNN